MKMPDHQTSFAALDSPTVSFNGKFLSAEMTGVHRVAEELIGGIDRLLAEAGEDPRFGILCPGGPLRRLDTHRLRRHQAGLLRWIAWEQIELPLRTRGHLLVNLCNLGPLASRRAFTLVHDAQVYLTPRSYSRAFRLWYRLCLPILGRRNLRILTVSHYSRAQLAAFGIASADRIAVIPNGVDHVLRSVADCTVTRRHGLVPRRYACALANTQKHKNIPLLFEAFARPDLQDLSLVLIGAAGPDDFRRQGYPPPPNVVFAGRLTDGEFRGLIEDAVAFLCPSTTEGFGLPPLESMALGTPAIAAPEGALPEVCGDAALYADARDPAAWARAICSLADDPEAREARSRIGRAHAAQFTWRKAALALLAVIAESAPTRAA